MNGVRLPPGFTSRVIARTGQRVASSDYAWHLFPDGGATYATDDGGWIYVSNSETPLIPPALKGGVGAVRFDRDGRITSAYRILDNTSINCAGGKTPWHTWLSCEESPGGGSCSRHPWASAPPYPRPALGCSSTRPPPSTRATRRSTSPKTRPTGASTASRRPGALDVGHPDPSEGVLEVAELRDERFVWHRVPDPLFVGEARDARAGADVSAFNGGEGARRHEGTAFFSTKGGDNKARAYDRERSRAGDL